MKINTDADGLIESALKYILVLSLGQMQFFTSSKHKVFASFCTNFCTLPRYMTYRKA